MSAKRRARTLDHQVKHVFTPAPADKRELLLSQAAPIAKANNCILLDETTDIKWVDGGEGRNRPCVVDKSTGKPFKEDGFSAKVLIVGKCTKHYDSPESVFRDGLDAPMTGTEKQTYYIEPLDGHRGSKAAVKQLLRLYNPEGTAWAEAASKTPNHAVKSTLKKKGASEKQILEHAKQLAQRGSVFFPVHSDEDGNKTLRLSNKLVQSRRTYTRAIGTGFDIDTVDAYFTSADNKDKGIRLTSFLGRDGKAWQGKCGDIKAINIGFFIVSLYSDYFAPKISKFTMPHRLETIVCIDCTTSTGGSTTVVIPNMQELMGLPGENGDDPISSAASPESVSDDDMAAYVQEVANDADGEPSSKRIRRDEN